MAADVLQLGGIAFTNYSTPAEMMGGGRQTIVVHKLPGGSRVIDTLGPDDAQITWRGIFFGDDAYSTARAVDGLRSQGSPVALTWGGQHFTVIVTEFVYKVKRLPVYVDYTVVCTIVTNPMQGLLAAVPLLGAIDTLIGGDLGGASATSMAAAVGAASLNAAAATAATDPQTAAAALAAAAARLNSGLYHFSPVSAEGGPASRTSRVIG